MSNENCIYRTGICTVATYMENCAECDYNTNCSDLGNNRPCGQQNCWYGCTVCQYNGYVYCEETE